MRAEPNETVHRILITRASVAFKALACSCKTRLRRHREFCEGGQNVDVRCAGSDVLKKMGLEPAVADSSSVPKMLQPQTMLGVVLLRAASRR